MDLLAGKSWDVTLPGNPMLAMASRFARAQQLVVAFQMQMFNCHRGTDELWSLAVVDVDSDTTRGGLGCETALRVAKCGCGWTQHIAAKQCDVKVSSGKHTEAWGAYNEKTIDIFSF